MLSKSKSSGHAGFTTSGVAKKKKPAPPRPPQPSVNRMPTSQSFTASSDLKNRIGQRSRSISVGRPDGDDLIDFGTPIEGPTKLQSRSNEVPDFKYRVGASMFFIKSPLVNSISNSSTRSQPENPFSPPRPSAQALSRTTNNNSYTTSSSQHYTTTGLAAKSISKPTIIKPQQPIDFSQAWNENSNNTNTAASKFAAAAASVSAPASRPYSNVPLEWDEPPKKITAPVSKPTVIKPVPPPKKPGLGLGTKPVSVSSSSAPKTFPSGGPPAVPVESRPYYDVPPGFDDFDDDDDDDDDDDFISKPMPNEPPPPPPSDYEVEGWVDNQNTNRASTTETEQLYSEPYARTSVADRAYAIALYDYTPEADGDLALQAGDLIYLTRKIDDSWLCGSCGGIEGMFPSNYCNVVVPLPEEDTYSVPVEDDNNRAIALEDQFVKLYANIDYDFAAETESDLNLRAGEVVTILGRINEDWIYGEMEGYRGQFPAAFVSPVPIDLPTIKF